MKNDTDICLVLQINILISGVEISGAIIVVWQLIIVIGSS